MSLRRPSKTSRVARSFPSSLIGALTITIVPATPAGAEVYFGNLHSHTSYSDGQGTPREAYRHARDVAGLDFLAITEHNHKAAPSKLPDSPELYNGSQSSSLISQATRNTKDGSFVALYGQEFSSIGSGNHANVLEVGEVIQTSQVPNGAWDQLLNTWLPNNLDSQGHPAILLLNHPSQSSSPNDREYGIDDFNDFETWRSRLDHHAQLINIINGPSHDSANPGSPSESEFLRYLNMGLHVAPTADQDNHRKNWGSAADTRTGVIADELSRPAILDALRNRHVYATQDKNLKIEATLAGHLIGTIVPSATLPAVGSAIPIGITINDGDEPAANYTIDVFTDQIGGAAVADVIMQFVVDSAGDPIGNGSYTFQGPPYEGGSQYVFLRITQSDPDFSSSDRAWLAPVWFQPGATLPTVGAGAATLEVNLELEFARITNVGDAPLNLDGWRLLSRQGNQQFEFGANTIIAPGQSILVTSGPNSENNPPNVIRWSTQNIWRNAGDPAALIAADGTIVAETS